MGETPSASSGRDSGPAQDRPSRRAQDRFLRQAHDEAWLLLIYTVPAQPSRKRAFIWRELKKAGAVYLRDGVCALPERPETAAVLSAVAAKVDEFGGEATLIEAANLPLARAERIIKESQDARKQEYFE